MTHPHDSSESPVQKNAARFAAFVREHRGRFDASVITTNDGRGPFVAELALFPRLTAPRVKIVVGRGLAAIVPIYFPAMQAAAAESVREMFEVAIKIAHEFEGEDCGGTHVDMTQALSAREPGDVVLGGETTKLILDGEALAIVTEVREHLPRCVVCDAPATRRKDGSLFVKPDFGCDTHIPGAAEVKWAKLARLVGGVEARQQRAKTETAYNPLTDEAVLDLYRGIRAEMEPGDADEVEVGELLADMRHANLGPNRASRIAYLSDMIARHVLSHEGIGVRRLSLGSAAG